MSCLHILEIFPLSVALFTNIFFHTESCLFVYVSFAVQKFLRLIRIHLFIFVFIYITLKEQIEKYLAEFYSIQLHVQVFNTF